MLCKHSRYTFAKQIRAIAKDLLSNMLELTLTWIYCFSIFDKAYLKSGEINALNIALWCYLG